MLAIMVWLAPAGSSLVHPPCHGDDAISPQGITPLVLPIASGTGAVFAFQYSLAALVAGAAVLVVSSALGTPEISP